MIELQKVPEYQPVARVPQTTQGAFSYTPIPQSRYPVPTVTITQEINPASLTENKPGTPIEPQREIEADVWTRFLATIPPSHLVAWGNILAVLLGRVLDQLKAYDEHAVYLITSILEPYREETEELDLRMPPLSSKKVTINVTDRGRAKPDLYIE